MAAACSYATLSEEEIKLDRYAKFRALGHYEEFPVIGGQWQQARLDRAAVRPPTHPPRRTKWSAVPDPVAPTVQNHAAAPSRAYSPNPGCCASVCVCVVSGCNEAATGLVKHSLALLCVRSEQFLASA